MMLCQVLIAMLLSAYGLLFVWLLFLWATCCCVQQCVAIRPARSLRKGFRIRNKRKLFRPNAWLQRPRLQRLTRNGAMIYRVHGWIAHSCPFLARRNCLCMLQVLISTFLDVSLQDGNNLVLCCTTYLQVAGVCAMTLFPSFAVGELRSSNPLRGFGGRWLKTVGSGAELPYDSRGIGKIHVWIIEPLQGRTYVEALPPDMRLIDAISGRVPRCLSSKCQFVCQTMLLDKNTSLAMLPPKPIIRIKMNPLLGAGPNCMLVLPGNAFDQKVLLSQVVAQQLLQQSLVEEVESLTAIRNFVWCPGTSTDEQWTSLLACMPDSKQKQALEKKREKNVAPAPVLSGAALEPKQPDLPDFEKLMVFLTNIVEGAKLSEVGRKLMGKISKILHVPQKIGQRKRSQKDLAVACLDALQTKDSSNVDVICELIDVVEEVSQFLSFQDKQPTRQCEDDRRQKSIPMDQELAAHSWEEDLPEPMDVDDDHITLEPVERFLQKKFNGAEVLESARNVLVNISKILQVPARIGQQKRNKNLADLAKACMQALKAEPANFDVVTALLQISKDLLKLPILEDNFGENISENRKENHLELDVPVQCQTSFGQICSFLKDASDGMPVSRQARITLADIAKTIGVKQKEGGQKKNTLLLANECLQFFLRQPSFTARAGRHLEDIQKSLPSHCEGMNKADNCDDNNLVDAEGAPPQDLGNRDVAASATKKKLVPKKIASRKRKLVKTKEKNEFAASGSKNKLIKKVRCTKLLSVYRARKIKKQDLQKIVQDNANKKQTSISKFAKVAKNRTQQDVRQDPLEVLKIRVKNEICFFLDRLPSANLRRLAKTYFVAASVPVEIAEAKSSEQNPRKSEFLKGECLRMLKPKIEIWFDELLASNKISHNTNRATAVEILKEQFLQAAEPKTYLWQWRAWNKAPEKDEPHSDQKTRGKQLCKQLLEYYAKNHCYPEYSRVVRENWAQQTHSDKALIATNRRMRTRYIKLQREKNLTTNDLSFLDDVQSLPCWTHKHPGSETYVPGVAIGDENSLHCFADSMAICCPDVCLLCGCSFACAFDLAKHCVAKHGGYCEYRKRCLYFARDADLVLQPQAKRAIIQNVSQFEVACIPGSGNNDWAGTDDVFVERGEVACAVCARLDFLEMMQKVRLFQTSCQMGDSDGDQSSASEEPEKNKFNQARRRVCQETRCIQNVEKVDALLSVRRYAKRWPLIPTSELYASSIVHPQYPNMKWLLHTRVVPMKAGTFGAKGADLSEPGCAGVGDELAASYLCGLCSASILRKSPRMPAPALANDLWVGRFCKEFSSLTTAEQMLLSLGRPVFRKVLLGRKGVSPDELQTALAGNSVFLAQPTGGVPTMELPPGPDALSDHVVVAFAGQTTVNLDKAHWALVRKPKYLQAAKHRKSVCPAFKDVKINDHTQSNILPEHGVPDSLLNCTLALPDVSEIKQYFPGLAGSDQKMTDQNHVGSEGDTSGSEAIGQVDTESKEDIETKEVNEPIIALSSADDHDATLMFTAFQTKMQLLEEEAKKVAQNEKDELLQCEGVHAACVDEGGRQVCREIVVDLQETVRKLNGEAKIKIEEALRQSATSKSTGTSGLAVPVGQPLSWYDPATWPACFIEFVYGDAVPGLELLPYLFGDVLGDFSIYSPNHRTVYNTVAILAQDIHYYICVCVF